MLLPSILRMLDQNQSQPQPAEPPKPKVPAAKGDEASGLQKIEDEIAAAAELAKLSGQAPQFPGNPAGGPFLEELLRAITKFEKSDQSRVVDVFE